MRNTFITIAFPALVKRVYDINLNYLGVRSQSSGVNPPLAPPRRGRKKEKE
ncbi:hypothetical protein [Okeania sp. SIO1I7]|uniref:hypothetical protein n=1 Tax=Okeania sp. SIO1I7 TaxID=2607772 RepID=UPI0013FCA14A|nr:hypothetical protein [Okeania sp. SIO1I7]NET24109.1 hypothetical protein [Okeania sp. SIO1I7]